MLFTGNVCTVMVALGRRVRARMDELGALVACLYGVDRLLRRIHPTWGLYCYYFVALPLADQPRVSPTRGRAFAFRLLQTHEPVLDGLARPAAVIRARFMQGAQCLVATQREQLVGCIWFVRNAYAEDEVRVDYRLPPDGRCVWDFDVFVAPAQRLGFLFAKQWDAFNALLRPQGIRYTVSRINAFNPHSLASHRSLGARECGRALFLRLGSWQWMVSNRRPFMAFGGRPVLHIDPAQGKPQAG